MADYRFNTTWRVQASLQDAWTVLFDAESWPAWWPSVQQVDQLAVGSPDGLGRRLRYRFSTRLPYTLSFEAELVEVLRPTRLVASAEGELDGTWTCELVQDGDSVVVRHDWAVKTTQPWMNVLAPVARPVFAWNHASLMREGGKGFGAMLGTTGHVEDDPGARRTVAASAGVAAAVAVLAGALLVRTRRRHR